MTIALNKIMGGVTIHQTSCEIPGCHTRIEYTSDDIKKHKSKSYSHVVCPSCGHSVVVAAARKVA